MAAVRCKRNSEGRTLSSRQAHESQVKIPRFHIQYLNVHSSKYEIVLKIEGRRRVHLPRYSEGRVTRRGGRKACLLLPWKNLFRGE